VHIHQLVNVASLISLCVLCGCAAAQQHSDVTTGKSISNSIGASIDGKPLTIERFGDGAVRVLILAGIHGNERESVALADRFVRHLKTRPGTQPDSAVAIIPCANPDGYYRNTRANANGIDLNRNFPATNFRAARQASTRPADQPETIALMRVIEELRPSLIISIHSMPAGGECNNFDGPAEQVAGAMSAQNHYRVARTIGYPTPGSMGSYYGIDRGIAIITLELPRGAPEIIVWEANRDALIAAISSAATALRSSGRPE
jgi:predicted deacylase